MNNAGMCSERKWRTVWMSIIAVGGIAMIIGGAALLKTTFNVVGLDILSVVLFVEISCLAINKCSLT